MKRPVNSQHFKDKRTKQRDGSPWALGIDLKNLFDLSQISEKRKHLYVCSILLLLFLLAHLLKSSG